MTWGLAQAGDRASKTRCYLQWRENKPEQDAVASALQNLHNSVCYYIVASSYKLCTLINYVQKRPNLLPIKGDAWPLLRLGVAFGTYDLGATLLCYGKFEHSVAMYGNKKRILRHRTAAT